MSAVPQSSSFDRQAIRGIEGGAGLQHRAGGIGGEIQSENIGFQTWRMAAGLAQRFDRDAAEERIDDLGDIIMATRLTGCGKRLLAGEGVKSAPTDEIRPSRSRASCSLPRQISGRRLLQAMAITARARLTSSNAIQRNETAAGIPALARHVGSRGLLPDDVQGESPADCRPAWPVRGKSSSGWRRFLMQLAEHRFSAVRRVEQPEQENIRHGKKSAIRALLSRRMAIGRLRPRPAGDVTTRPAR